MAKPHNCTLSVGLGIEKERGVPSGQSSGLAEGRQLHQIILRNGLQMASGFAPGGEAADDHERVESFFPQYVRHPGASCFACSSTVEVKVLIFGEILNFLFQVVGLDANRSKDAFRTDIVVAMTTYVDDLQAIALFGRKP